MINFKVLVLCSLFLALRMRCAGEKEKDQQKYIRGTVQVLLLTAYIFSILPWFLFGCPDLSVCA